MKTRIALAGFCICSWLPNVVLATQNREIHDFAVAFRVQVYETFREDRDEYDQRIEKGERVMQMARDAHNPQSKSALLQWYHQALRRSRKSTMAELPGIPDIAQFETRQPATTPRAAPTTKDVPDDPAVTIVVESHEQELAAAEPQSRGFLQSLRSFIGWSESPESESTAPADGLASDSPVVLVDEEPPFTASSDGLSTTPERMAPASTPVESDVTQESLENEEAKLAEAPEGPAAAIGEVDDSEATSSFEMLAQADAEMDEHDADAEHGEFEPIDVLELNARIAGHNLALAGLQAISDQAFVGDTSRLPSIVDRFEVLAKNHHELAAILEDAPVESLDKLISLDDVQSFAKAFREKCRGFQPEASTDGSTEWTQERLENLRGQLDTVYSIYFEE